MKKYLTVTAFAAAFAAGGCGIGPMGMECCGHRSSPSGPAPEAQGSIQGRAFLAQAEDHSGIIVTVNGTSFLASTTSQGGYVIAEVSPGVYTLMAQRANYSSAVQFGVRVIGGETTTVPDMTLYPLVSSGNHPPVINTMNNVPLELVPGGTTTITVSAQDAEGGALSYTWEASAGTISGSGAQVTWTAPQYPGTYVITVTVTDIAGNQAKGYLSIIVGEKKS